MEAFNALDRKQALTTKELGVIYMLKVELLQDKNIAVLTPSGKLQAADFQQAASTIDPWIESNGKLNGIVIAAEEFPGWDSIQGLLAHLKFVRDHHKKINRVAFASDSSMLGFVQSLADHFTSAELKIFTYSSLNEAIDWASNS